MKQDIKHTKTEHLGFLRDSYSQAIINTDNESFKIYKQLREERLKTQALTHDVGALKHDIGEIKDMLKALLGK